MPEILTEVAPQPTAESQEKATGEPSSGPLNPPDKEEEKNPFETEREDFSDKITKFLERNKFYFDQDEFKTQIADPDRRYLTLRGLRIEEGQLPRERFFKAPMPQREAARQAFVSQAFQRQILAHDFLDERTDFPVSEVIEYNLDPNKGPVHAIMNTYDEGVGVGFLHTSEDIKKLQPRHAGLVVKAIRELAHHEEEVKPDLAEVLEKRPPYQDFKGYLDNVTTILNKEVNGTGEFYSQDHKTPLHKILESKTGMADFREKALQLAYQLRPIIEKTQEGIHFVHGDLAPNNLFLGDGVEALELMVLDFEYFGISGNEVLAAVYDFGNLRARAWNNEDFRLVLDKEMIDSYEKEGRGEVGRTIVALGILRSHMNLAGFFENYPPEKSTQPDQTERREATEKDIAKAWEIASEIKI